MTVPIEYEKIREQVQERFSKKLWRREWKKHGNSFFKGNDIIEMDDLGFFLWVDGFRAAGMAWDFLERYTQVNLLIFKNGVYYDLDFGSKH